MIGDAAVGKSSLLLRFAVRKTSFTILFKKKDNTFQDSYMSTIGVDFVIPLLF